MIRALSILMFTSLNMNRVLAQQWPAQITSMNAAGQRLSPQSNTFPLNAMRGGPGGGSSGGFQMGPLGSMGPMGSMGSMGSMNLMGAPGGGFPMMGGNFPTLSQRGNPSFGGMQSHMPQMSPQTGGFFGGGGGGGGQMPFLPVQHHGQQMGGGPSQGMFPMGMGHQQMPFQQHQQQQPRQFGQRQFQPMGASFQQNSPPQQQNQNQQLSNSVQESATSGGSLPKFLEGAPEETITEVR